jgi:hypothetical protein
MHCPAGDDLLLVVLGVLEFEFAVELTIEFVVELPVELAIGLPVELAVEWAMKVTVELGTGLASVLSCRLMSGRRICHRVVH